MGTLPQIEPVSTKHLLACLGLAIDEAKLIRSLIQSKEMADKLERDNPFSDQSIRLNREITYLESKLAEVRSKVSRG